MAKKKAATKKKTVKKAVKKKAAKKSPAKKKAAKKKATAARKSATSKTVPAKKAAKKAPAKASRKKGVRRATMTTGIRTKKQEKTIGRSRIPLDAPLSVVFEHFPEEKKAFELLNIQTIRELEEFGPDELVMRLTSPAKQTVGRIRKILAMNNRCLAEDEAFAIEFQEKLASRRLDQ